MDDLDFAQRYRDVNECNPFHWHPLHLPEKCLQMFEKLIRSGLRSFTPYRIVKEKQQQIESVYSSSYLDIPIYRSESRKSYNDIEPQTPFQVLFKMIRRDVKSIPSAPTLAISPFLGVVALYRQPVSYKTVDMIKKLSKAYANSYY